MLRITFLILSALSLAFAQMGYDGNENLFIGLNKKH